jgi:hypothetical protein
MMATRHWDVAFMLRDMNVAHVDFPQMRKYVKDLRAEKMNRRKFEETERQECTPQQENKSLPRVQRKIGII